MTPEQKEAVVQLRLQGLGYKAISSSLSLSVSTIKSYCKRHELIKGNSKVALQDYCLSCGRVLEHRPSKKKKRFCGSSCRNKWWNSHLDEVRRKAFTNHVCQNCSQAFQSYGNPKRLYCSHRCYIAYRFGGGEDGETI